MTNNIIRRRIKSIIIGILLTYTFFFQYKAVELSPALEKKWFCSKGIFYYITGFKWIRDCSCIYMCLHNLCCI